jgi:hypothetical protein
MILYRLDKEKELKEWDLYLINYEHMDKKSFKTFDEWRKRKVDKKDEPSKEEIIRRAEEVKEIHQRKKKNNKK